MTAHPAVREKGLPGSSNQASSMSLAWTIALPVRSARAILEILYPPRVDALYFWALQVSFVDPDGTDHGAGHLGLQWSAQFPGKTAVNWGGYTPQGVEL